LNSTELILELLNTIKELINTIADVQNRLEILEEDSHAPVDWEEVIYANTKRIEYLERKLSERNSK